MGGVSNPPPPPGSATAPGSSKPAAPSGVSTPPPAAGSSPATTKAPAKSTSAKATTPEPKKYGRFTARQWIIGSVLGLLALIAAAALVAVATRWLLSTGPGADFIARYPGHPELPEDTPVGLPAWLSWQHFLNMLFIVLILKSGLQIRSERRPEAYWTPKFGNGKKISLTTWFHQAVDIFWVLNGFIYIVLLFATGQWKRLVPTTWDVFPHALSAVLQYLTFDWPTENGWIHYNAMQQLTYFFTVFIAAPLAIITGLRMSTLWSAKWTRLSRALPLKITRKVHVGVMVYFLVFAAIHVILVTFTGLLSNLNHMYAGRGSADPTEYAHDWTGLIVFLVSVAVIAAAAYFARPVVLAPVAKHGGEVTGR
ncbi:cytochrome b/b6 domain-containing protein [Corynebacterium doosanense]|uniref:Membrane protein n=1 Tax=Corynebacterium doosanense CAU 212 = DSM 45436 TaxID=558173 RepID=A0A097IIA9_9CORY|nr:cytochrome b/b6 domain-containing protein [Corynebacterium doosanense]AIT61867.1 membrane protein [Corynebacterium doosanense CAU 212 = DSM 45436]